jgi:hypothetical protein
MALRMKQYLSSRSSRSGSSWTLLHKIGLGQLSSPDSLVPGKADWWKRLKPS